MSNKIRIQINKSIFKFSIFVAPVAILTFFALLRYGDERLYYFLLREDNPLEAFSAILYFIATGFAVYVAIGFLRLGKKWLGFVYSIISLGLFFIAGEEISWGQRILGVTSPEYFMNNSSQQEINLHNLKPVQEILHSIYIFVGLAGATSWIGLKITGGYGYLFNRWFIPNWYLCLYFLPVSMFYVYYDFIRPTDNFLGLKGRDQEPNEFILCLGFLLLVTESFIKMRELQAKPASSLFSVSVNSRQLPRP